MARSRRSSRSRTHVQWNAGEGNAHRIEQDRLAGLYPFVGEVSKNNVSFSIAFWSTEQLIPGALFILSTRLYRDTSAPSPTGPLRLTAYNYSFIDVDLGFAIGTPMIYLGLERVEELSASRHVLKGVFVQRHVFLIGGEKFVIINLNFIKPIDYKS